MVGTFSLGLIRFEFFQMSIVIFERIPILVQSLIQMNDHDNCQHQSNFEIKRKNFISSCVNDHYKHSHCWILPTLLVLLRIFLPQGEKRGTECEIINGESF